MSRRKPPVTFQSCCRAFGYLVDHGIVKAHTVTYTAPEFVEVEVLIGFVTATRYLHLHRKQHLFECPFCGTSLQGVVRVMVRDLGQQYGGEAPIRLHENPRTGRPTAHGPDQVEEARVRGNAGRMSWAKRRKQT